jgi:hypothetical protein
MRDLRNRADWLPISEEKPILPYTLDPTLTFYCPQENVEALDHPDVRALHAHMRDEYTPPAAEGNLVALLMPCTKTKPYSMSKEHREINHYLHKRGFKPVGQPDYPEQLLASLSPDYPVDVIHNGLLKRGDVFVHRMVVSEPMGLVPYEYLYHWRGQLSLAARYDDPGLFEQRGTAVCLWRDDNTAVEIAGGKYRWGPNERAAFAQVHNALSELIAALLTKFGPAYHRLIGYVSPKLTHRSFLTSRAEKRANGIPLSKRVSGGSVALIGVNDLQPGLVEVVPSPGELESILSALARRLSAEPGMTPARVRAVFASGGGGATPLILPEALAVLEEHLSGKEVT